MFGYNTNTKEITQMTNDRHSFKKLSSLQLLYDILIIREDRIQIKHQAEQRQTEPNECIIIYI